MRIKSKSFLTALLLLILSSGSWGQERVLVGAPDRWLGRDKLAHFTVSLAAVGLTNHWLLAENDAPPSRARNRAAGLSLSLGLFKELHDGTQKGNRFSFRDLTADILGAGLGTALFTIN